MRFENSYNSKNYNKLELSGHKYGRLLVIRPIGRNKHLQIIWECLCECGNLTKTLATKLKSGRAVSCGCINKERLIKMHTTHNLSKSPLYKKWKIIRNRCNNPKHEHYKYYGGKGIKMCDRWNDFNNFYDDMFPTYKKGLTIERINPNGGYQPDNCKWDTVKNQARNKTNNRIITYKGITGCVSMICEHFGIKSSIVYRRLNKGWSIENAFNKK